MIQIAVFAVVAAVAVIAGVSLVLTRNAVHSALFLVGVQLCLAVLFLLQGAFLVSVLQIMVYAGAIMVLFIFVVMLLGVDKKEALIEPLRWQRPLAAGLGLLLVAEAIYLALSQHIHVGSGGLKAAPNEGNVQSVARVLFTHWALPFEATSVLLVVAVVGVMVVARRPRPPSSGRTEDPRPPSSGRTEDPRPPSSGRTEDPRPPSSGRTEERTV